MIIISRLILVFLLVLGGVGRSLAKEGPLSKETLKVWGDAQRYPEDPWDKNKVGSFHSSQPILDLLKEDAHCMKEGPLAILAIQKKLIPLDGIYNPQKGPLAKKNKYFFEGEKYKTLIMGGQLVTLNGTIVEVSPLTKVKMEHSPEPCETVTLTLEKGKIRLMMEKGTTVKVKTKFGEMAFVDADVIIRVSFFSVKITLTQGHLLFTDGEDEYDFQAKKIIKKKRKLGSFSVDELKDTVIDQGPEVQHPKEQRFSGRWNPKYKREYKQLLNFLLESPDLRVVEYARGYEMRNALRLILRDLKKAVEETKEKEAEFKEDIAGIKAIILDLKRQKVREGVKNMKKALRTAEKKLEKQEKTHKKLLESMRRYKRKMAETPFGSIISISTEHVDADVSIKRRIKEKGLFELEEEAEDNSDDEEGAPLFDEISNVIQTLQPKIIVLQNPPKKTFGSRRIRKDLEDKTEKIEKYLANRSETLPSKFKIKSRKVRKDLIQPRESYPTLEIWLVTRGI